MKRDLNPGETQIAGTRSDAVRHPIVLDLFAGCGGLSLGFMAAGFQILDGVESSDIAHQTHIRNLKPLRGATAAVDIRDTTAAELIGAGPRPHVVVGGPPCQPFTRVGRAKLREVAGMVAAHVHDDRVTLYEHYLRIVAEVQPYAFVMENVPDLGRFAGRNIAEEIAVTAESLGYNVRYALLNAVWYGVPQMRERVIILGIHSDLAQLPLFPSKTHTIELPRGYITSRSRANGHFLAPIDHYYGDVDEVLNPSPAITAQQALSDMPPITEHLDHMEARRGRREGQEISFLHSPRNHYQALMRTWLDHSGVPPRDHVIRYTPRDYGTFRLMKPGNQYPQALEIAKARFAVSLKRAERQLNRKIKPGTEAYKSLWASIVPPYDGAKFPNKWRKMEPDAPARTIPAHIGKDSYSHIHYDSKQARMISVREAARLQSFPDHFSFAGSMNDAFRQIGNSVPPLMAYAIARSLRCQLEAAGVVQPANLETQPIVGDLFERGETQQ